MISVSTALIILFVLLFLCGICVHALVYHDLQDYKRLKEQSVIFGNNVKYSMFVGRWQPWHAGHRWLIDQRLNQGKNVLICIRDVVTDDNNPYDPVEVLENLNQELNDLIQAGRVKVIIIPDIESINYGRGVGYEIIEHIPPKDIHDISATKIRQENGRKNKSRDKETYS